MRITKTQIIVQGSHAIVLAISTAFIDDLRSPRLFTFWLFW